MAEIGDPTEDTEKGAGGMVPVITWSYKTTGAAQDEVEEEAVMLVGDRTRTTEEVEVCKGVMVTTPTNQPPPIRMGI